MQKESDRKASYEEVDKIDKEVDTYIATAMKIKDREMRRELMEKV